MNEEQTALIERVRTHFNQIVTKLERLRYVVANQPEVTDGALIIWFGDGLLCFDVEGDGERLRVCHGIQAPRFFGVKPKLIQGLAMDYRYLTALMTTLLVLVLAASCCSAASEDLWNTSANASHAGSAASTEIRCNITSKKDGSFVIAYEIANHSSETIHIISNRGTPYQLTRDSNVLVIFYGFHAYNPLALPSIIEMPVTRPLRSGEFLRGTVVWPMRVMQDYWGGHGTPASLLHGAIKVRCEVGWWSLPITDADRMRLRFQNVLATQQVAGYGPLEITLP